MRILVVDDEKEFTKLLQDFLRQRGYCVDCVFDGREALRLLKENNYDLVFLDQNMPRLSGFELIKFIKRYNIRTKTVVIACYPSMEDQFAKSVGADEYINKPCRMEEIRRIIDSHAYNGINKGES